MLKFAYKLKSKLEIHFTYEIHAKYYQNPSQKY